MLETSSTMVKSALSLIWGEAQPKNLHAEDLSKLEDCALHDKHTPLMMISINIPRMRQMWVKTLNQTRII